EVALRLDAQVPAAVLPQLLEHVVEERDPRRRARLPGAVDVECELDLGLLRLAVLLRRPVHATLTSSTASRSAARKASFSSGVPTVTRRLPANRGQLEKSRTRTPRSTSRCQSACPSPWTRSRTKFAPDGNAVTPSTFSSSAWSRSRSRTRSVTRSSISPPYRRASTPASCVGAARWYGRTTFSSSSTTHGGATQKPRRSAAIDQTFEYVRATTSGPSSATSRIALRSANSPYASSTTTRPSVASRSASTVSAGS